MPDDVGDERNTEPKMVRLTLNPNGVAQPTERVAIIASHVVGTCLRALANDDLSLPEMRAGFMGFQFDGLDMPDEERRETYQNWILSKGFQDLARGVRETLEEAVFYLEMVEMRAGRTTLGELETYMATIRANAGKPSFPKLLEGVNARLTEPMAFEAEFLSLQKVRNCLEHRGGRVGPKDVDPATGMMTLNFPRLRITIGEGEEAVEVVENHFVEKESAVNIGRVTRSREYALGERVLITASDFYEIAMACQLFAMDVAAKLPTLPQIESGGSAPPEGEK